jgi:hypothetical protein
MRFTPEEVLSEALAHAVAGGYVVLEFETGDDGTTQVRDVTDHLRALERQANDADRFQ